MCDGVEPARVLVQGHGVEADQAVAVAIKTDIAAAIRHQARNNKACNSTHVTSVAIDDIGKLGVGSRICVELREGHTGRGRLGVEEDVIDGREVPIMFSRTPRALYAAA
jgi:hypothetical protein